MGEGEGRDEGGEEESEDDKDDSEDDQGVTWFRYRWREGVGGNEICSQPV
jgi:hypothetical protein